MTSAELQEHLHSVISLVGGNVIPGDGNTFDVATEQQRIFLRVVDSSSFAKVRESTRRKGEEGQIDYKSVWLEGFARAILIRNPNNSSGGYLKLRDILRSYVRCFSSGVLSKSTRASFFIIMTEVRLISDTFLVLRYHPATHID